MPARCGFPTVVCSKDQTTIYIGDTSRGHVTAAKGEPDPQAGESDGFVTIPLDEQEQNPTPPSGAQDSQQTPAANPSENDAERKKEAASKENVPANSSGDDAESKKKAPSQDLVPADASPECKPGDPQVHIGKLPSRYASSNAGLSSTEFREAGAGALLDGYADYYVMFQTRCLATGKTPPDKSEPMEWPEFEYDEYLEDELPYSRDLNIWLVMSNPTETDFEGDLSIQYENKADENLENRVLFTLYPVGLATDTTFESLPSSAALWTHVQDKVKQNNPKVHKDFENVATASGVTASGSISVLKKSSKVYKLRVRVNHVPNQDEPYAVLKTDRIRLGLSTQDAEIAAHLKPGTPKMGQKCHPNDCLVKVKTQGSEEVRSKKIQNVCIGDLVEASHGRYEPVLAIPHSSTQVTAKYFNIYVDNADRPLKISPGHYLYADGKLTPPENVKVNQTLELDGRTTRINRVVQKGDVGLHHLTLWSGKLVVDGFQTSTHITTLPLVLQKYMITPFVYMLYMMNMGLVLTDPQRVRCEWVFDRFLSMRPHLNVWIQYGLLGVPFVMCIFAALLPELCTLMFMAAVMTFYDIPIVGGTVALFAVDQGLKAHL